MQSILIVAATEMELCGHPGLVCGVGPVESAIAVADALARGRASAIVHVGIAGARLSSGLGPPQLAIGERAVYEDLGTVRRLAPDVVLADRALVDAARRALPGAAVVSIGTTGKVGGGAGCPVEAMEGFAVLRAAELAGIPALEVRAISNFVEDARPSWRIEEALTALAGALPALVDSIAAATAKQ